MMAGRSWAGLKGGGGGTGPACKSEKQPGVRPVKATGGLKTPRAGSGRRSSSSRRAPVEHPGGDVVVLRILDDLDQPLHLLPPGAAAGERRARGVRLTGARVRTRGHKCSDTLLLCTNAATHCTNKQLPAACVRPKAPNVRPKATCVRPPAHMGCAVHRSEWSREDEAGRRAHLAGWLADLESLVDRMLP